MILTIALLFMCAAGIGIVYWMYRMIQSQMYVELLLNDTRDQVGEVKVMLASVRHDLSLDHEGMDERFDGVNGRIHSATNSLHDHLQRNLLFTEAEIRGEHQKTRKDIQEVKTRLADEEKQDQRAKAKARRDKKSVH